MSIGSSTFGRIYRHGRSLLDGLATVLVIIVCIVLIRTILAAPRPPTAGACFLDKAVGFPANSCFQRDPRKYLGRVLDALHHAYALGFPQMAADGDAHTLEVRVRKPGVTVRARKTYATSPGTGDRTAPATAR